MIKEINIYWTLQRLDDYRGPDSVRTHQCRKARSGDGRTYHIGGLGYREELFTRTIGPDGQLFMLRPETDVINLSVVGGLDTDNKYRNTATTDQMRTLANDLRSLINLAPEAILDATALHHFGITPPSLPGEPKKAPSFELWMVASRIGRGTIIQL